MTVENCLHYSQDTGFCAECALTNSTSTSPSSFGSTHFFLDRALNRCSPVPKWLAYCIGYQSDTGRCKACQLDDGFGNHLFLHTVMQECLFVFVKDMHCSRYEDNTAKCIDCKTDIWLDDYYLVANSTQNSCRKLITAVKYCIRYSQLLLCEECWQVDELMAPLFLNLGINSC